eukprot:297903-Chlamydomonas_euryale.AAC.1
MPPGGGGLAPARDRLARDSGQLAEDMERLHVAVCGLQEVRRSGTGERPLPSGWLILWIGGDKGQGGVGALLAPAARQALTQWAPWQGAPDRL